MFGDFLIPKNIFSPKSVSSKKFQVDMFEPPVTASENLANYDLVE
jgi:hypothetical protein